MRLRDHVGVTNCEGCVVHVVRQSCRRLGLNCRSPDYQEKVVFPLDRPGPPVHQKSGLRVKVASVTSCYFPMKSITKGQRLFHVAQWKRSYHQGRMEHTKLVPLSISIGEVLLKVHKIDICFGSQFEFCILNFVLFHCQFCLNIKILFVLLKYKDFVTIFFYWAMNGEDSIVPLSLRLRGIEFSLV